VTGENAAVEAIAAHDQKAFANACVLYDFILSPLIVSILLAAKQKLF